MALLRITALPCESGAPYYRRAGRCFSVGQSVEVEVSAQDEALLRASTRLRVEAVEAPKVEEPAPSTDRSPASSPAPEAEAKPKRGRKSKPAESDEPSDS